MVHEVVWQLAERRQGVMPLGDYLNFTTAQAMANFSPTPEINILKGDTCLTLHVRTYNLDRPEGTPLMQGLRKNLEALAEIIKDYQNAHVVGLSHTGFMPIAQRLGFITHEVELPERYRHNVVSSVLTSTSRELKGASGNLSFVMYYQTGSAFLTRYAGGAKDIC